MSMLNYRIRELTRSFFLYKTILEIFKIQGGESYGIRRR